MGLRATGTDLCITLSRLANALDRKTHSVLRNLPDPEFHQVHIEVNYNAGPAKRELQSVHDLCNLKSGNPNLAYFQQAFVSDPAKHTIIDCDLTLDVPPSEKHQDHYRGGSTNLSIKGM